MDAETLWDLPKTRFVAAAGLAGGRAQRAESALHHVNPTGLQVVRDQLTEGNAARREAGELERETEDGLVAQGLSRVTEGTADVCEDSPVEGERSYALVESHVSHSSGELHTRDWGHGVESGQEGEVG